MEFWKALKDQNNLGRTENDAITYKSTLNANLDWFSMAGGLRFQPEERILDLFKKAFYEDKLLAMKNLFYTRDIRGGLGERRVFRVVLDNLSRMFPDVVRKNLELVPFYGRWDDLLALLYTSLRKDVIAIINKQLEEDLKVEYPSLLAKWLPSENTSSKKTRKLARELMKELNMTPKVYRKTLSNLRKRIDIIESYLSKRNYTFDYSKVPSQALLKYKKVFFRNDYERYMEYLHSVSSRKVKINTETLSVVQIVREILLLLEEGKISEELIKNYEILWNNIANIDIRENAIVVADVSGSMEGACGQLYLGIAASIALALYYAENNRGVFANKFITFSAEPQLVEIKGDNIVEKVNYLKNAEWGSNTNIEKVFMLILDTAIKNNLSQKDLPDKIYIISDMEFDRATMVGDKEVLFKAVKNKYKDYGYDLPVLVFWNVSSRHNNVPVVKSDENVILISGLTQKLFESIIKGEEINPVEFMLEILNSERYSLIKV